MQPYLWISALSSDPAPAPASWRLPSLHGQCWEEGFEWLACNEMSVFCEGEWCLLETKDSLGRVRLFLASTLPDSGVVHLTERYLFIRRLTSEMLPPFFHCCILLQTWVVIQILESLLWRPKKIRWARNCCKAQNKWVMWRSLPDLLSQGASWFVLVLLMLVPPDSTVLQGASFA